MEEIWKPALGLEGIVDVSNLGRTRTLDRDCPVRARTRNGRTQAPAVQRRKGHILSPCVARHGYLEIAIKQGPERKKYRVHRLVGEAFVPGNFDGASIDHLDGNKLNNRVDNLEWVSLSENTRRAWEKGLVDIRGELHPSAKLTNLQAHAVVLLYQHNFPPSQIGEWFGVSSALVYKLIHGKKPLVGLRSRYPSKPHS